MKSKTPRSRPLLLAIVLLGALALPALAQNDPTVESRLNDVEAAFQQATTDNWQLYAPETFADAQKQLEKARESFRKGGKIDEIQKHLDRATQELNKIEQYAEIGQVVMTDAIEARSDALAAGAPDHAPEDWKKAKEKMHDTGRDVENGNHNQAREEAREAEDAFRAAELTAIRTDLLGTARQAQERAREAGADEKASYTWMRGVQAVESAEKILQGDRYQRDRASDQARAATREFEHATYIAGLVDAVEADDAERFEKLQLDHEAVLAEVAAVIDLDLDFTEGMGSAGETVLAGVKSLRTDRNNLRDELSRASSRADSLNLALMQVSEQEQSVQAAMRIEQQRQQALRELRNLFPEDQATVLQQGDQIICRIYGLSFPVGSSEIQPQNFELLTKIQSALRIFPDAEVVVEGHTDAAGDDDLNQRLSMQRAEAVRQYVVANMPAAAPRIEAKGYGESSPLTSNDTAEGRAKNRRIDIRLMDIEGSGVTRYGAGESVEKNE